MTQVGIREPVRSTRAVRKARDGVAGSAGALVFTLALLVCMVVLLVATRDLQPSAAVVPRAVGVPLVALLGYRLVREILARQRGPAPNAQQPEQARDEIGAVLWLLALPLAATVLGFVVGPATWIVAWLRIRAREPLRVALVGGAVAAIVILALFAGLLGARLPHGLFEAMFGA